MYSHLRAWTTSGRAEGCEERIRTFSEVSARSTFEHRGESRGIDDSLWFDLGLCQSLFSSRSALYTDVKMIMRTRFERLALGRTLALTAAMTSLTALVGVGCQKSTTSILIERTNAQKNALTSTADDLRTGWYPNQPGLNPNSGGQCAFGEQWAASRAA